ncbi:hypothetical protein BsWGS_13345 [Bradybaena similaris]
MDTQPSFIEEIDFAELNFLEVVGKGAFGVVSRAKWRSKDVAVKRIETESEKKAFMQELKQLSRVNHPNIVRLYGACREHPVCLVMEYAEGGSLYNVLHGSGQQPDYTAAHALSWCLQCAKGVEYLHNMKPKALVHRDLKPPNLLLIMGGTVLKICDFGTACDVQTHMTNNKGSAAWMAPEVFEGSNYSEKCDVFSWGIILWEVLTRRKPFDEIGGPAFRIMWAVHSGRRPPPIQNLPKPLETLMARCWSGNPPERPSMTEVVRIMNTMYRFFHGGDDPLVISRTHDADEDEEYNKSIGQLLVTPTVRLAGESRSCTISDTVRFCQDAHSSAAVAAITAASQDDKKPRGQMSAPPSLAASRESLNDPRSSRSATPVDTGKRLSADLTTLEEFNVANNQTSTQAPRAIGHRRSGSQGTTLDNMQVAQLKSHVGPGHRRIGSDEYTRLSTVSSPLSISTEVVASGSPVHHSNTYPSHLSHLGQVDNSSTGEGPAMSPPARSVSYQPPGPEPVVVSPRSSSLSSDPLLPALSQGQQAAFQPSVEHAVYNDPYFSLEPHLQNFYLEPHLQAIPPCMTNQESMQIFEEHMRLAQEYLRMQAEIAVLTQRKHELNKEREQQEERTFKSGQLADIEEYTRLSSENVSYMKV